MPATERSASRLLLMIDSMVTSTQLWVRMSSRSKRWWQCIRTVQNGANNAAAQLHTEGNTGSELDVLTKLQVLKEGNTLNHRVLAVEGTVHVGNGLAGENVGGDHLEETSAGRSELIETDRGCEGSVESAEDEGDDGENGERPPGHAGVTGVVRGLSDGIGGGEDAEEPPTGDLLVNLHLLVVLIVDDHGGLVPWVE